MYESRVSVDVVLSFPACCSCVLGCSSSVRILLFQQGLVLALVLVLVGCRFGSHLELMRSSEPVTLPNVFMSP